MTPRVIVLALLLVVSSSRAWADGAPGSVAAPSPVAEPPASFELVIGPSLGWQYRRDFGNATRAAFSPELLAALYLPTRRPRLYLRPAVRVGYTGLDQSEQPDAIKIEERDILGSLELAAVFDGPIIPSLAIGGGAMIRLVDLDVDDPLDTMGDSISRTETLARLFVQAGLGLPLRRGTVLLEPNLRYELVFGDDRIAWRGGVDVTVEL